MVRKYVLLVESDNVDQVVRKLSKVEAPLSSSLNKRLINVGKCELCKTVIIAKKETAPHCPRCGVQFFLYRIPLARLADKLRGPALT